ncbi:MAG: hypothetical protein ACRDJ1_09810 [Actinomycetota bacterium]
MAAKTRKTKVDPEILKELEDLDRRMRETDRRVAVTLEKARLAQEKLRALIARAR